MIGKCNTGGENVTPEVTTQTPIIQNITEALVGKAMGANATAETILEGYSAYVGQQLVNGTAKDANTMIDMLSVTGCTKIAVDKFTFSTRTNFNSSMGTISHSLGKIPKIIIILSSMLNRDSTSSNMVNAFFMPIGGYSYNFSGVSCNTSTSYPGTYASSSFNLNATSDGINKQSSSTVYFEAGVEYTLITAA